MKKNRLFLLISIILIITLTLSMTAAARDIPEASVGSDDTIERGVQWEMLNNEVYILDDVLNYVGNDFTSYYTHTLKNALAVAKELLDSPASTTGQLREMTGELSFLRAEKDNPANHERYGCYTVAFTNTQYWSDPIYLYNWSDTSEEVIAWPGEAMRGGYTNEYGQKQYYAFVPMDIPNIIFSADRISDTGQYTSAATRVQTVDLTVFGNTGFYLTGERDGAKYKAATWELKQPDYKQYYIVDPITPDPTTPTEMSTVSTEPATEIPSVGTDIPTEQPTQFDINDYIPSYGGMLDFYELPIENAAQERLRQAIINATSVLAPGNLHTPEYLEKLNRIRNFAVTVYNDSRSADNELDGARLMLEAAVDSKSYEEIVAVMQQWFNMPVVIQPDPTTAPIPATEPTDGVWEDALSNHRIGDADGDGEITVMDATRVQRVLADYDADFRAMAERFATLTGDRLTILDATEIQRHLAGFSTAAAIGEFFQ